jgi:dethiobiotin synthetase
MPGLLITGTDTGVGKTLVGCGLATTLSAQSKTVGVMKPAETGCAPRDGVLYPEDAARLAAFARTPLSLDRVCPYQFALPVAPSVAAARAASSIDPSRLVAVFRENAAQCDYMLVEGAGGLLVPLVGRYTFAELARDLDLPLLLVVGSKLGALNHTLLTLQCAQAHALPVIGYIVNHTSPETDEATQTNVQTLAQLTDVPCVGVLPFTRLTGDVEQDRKILQELFVRAVDLEKVLG